MIWKVNLISLATQCASQSEARCQIEAFAFERIQWLNVLTLDVCISSIICIRRTPRTRELYDVCLFYNCMWSERVGAEGVGAFRMTYECV